MLSRPHASPSLRRLVRSASSGSGSAAHTISRLQLDINAAHHADQQSFRTPAAPVKTSPEALRGQSIRGDVQLPRELQEAVEKAIEKADDNPALRLSALELYAHLRRTSSILPPPASYRDRQALTSTYDAPTSLAYLAGLMPSIYGATLHALTTARDRLRVLGDWEPQRMVDYGSGTGSAAWAFEAVWGPAGEGGARKYVGLDASRCMVELSSSVLGALPRRIGGEVEHETERDAVVAGTSGEAREELRLDARAYQLPIPSSASSLAKLHLSPASSFPGTGQRTLAIAAFSLGDQGLGDQGTKEKRKEFVRAMWASGAEVLVIVERGTPGGSRMVVEAREQLLMYGRREETQEERVEGEAGPERGSFVLAPCPHDGACPLHNSSRSFCHFTQRVRSPPFLRHTKHTTRGEDDAAFSYVVIMRGTRPPATVVDAPTGVADAAEQVENGLDVMDDKHRPYIAKQETPGDELAWARVVAPPLKRSGHIILEVCAASGQLERHTIPKSQGRQEYYDARKSLWGDSFPHAPKNGPMPAPVGKEEVPEDKFGNGKSKVKSKKEERTGRGKDERSGRGRRGGEKGSDGEVQDFELEIGADGELKIMN